ncbi:MAG: hypothetical protein RSF00_06560, partial [Oscillospiraceae bacterium]
KSISVCNECGMDKAVLFSAMGELESGSREGTRVFAPISADALNHGEMNETRAFTPQQGAGARSGAARSFNKNAYSIMILLLNLCRLSLSAHHAFMFWVRL